MNDQKNYGLRKVLGVLFGLLLMIIGGKLKIDTDPIPFTLQTYALLVVLFLLPAKATIVTAIFYLGLGALGLPVFTAGKVGIPAFTGPGGGYLWGFFVATLLLAYLPKYRTFIGMSILGIVAHGVILACGVAQLSQVKTLHIALTYGLYPFFLPALTKSLLAALTVLIINRLRPSVILARKLRD